MSKNFLRYNFEIIITMTVIADFECRSISRASIQLHNTQSDRKIIKTFWEALGKKEWE